MGVLLGDRDDEPQVGFHHLGFRLERLGGELFHLGTGAEKILPGHPHKSLQGLELPPLRFNQGARLGRFVLRFQLLNEALARLDLILDVLCDQRHLFDGLLLVTESGEALLEPAVEFSELGMERVFFSRGRTFLPVGVGRIGLLVGLADHADQPAEHSQMPLAVLKSLGDYNAVERPIGRLANQLLRQRNMLFSRKTKTVEELVICI